MCSDTASFSPLLSLCPFKSNLFCCKCTWEGSLRHSSRAERSAGLVLSLFLWAELSGGTLNGQSISEMHRDGFQTVQVSLSEPVGVTNTCKPAEGRIGLYFICSVTHLVRLLAPGSTGFIQPYLSVGMSKIKSLKPVTYRNQVSLFYTPRADPDQTSLTHFLPHGTVHLWHLHVPGSIQAKRYCPRSIAENKNEQMLFSDE